MSLNPKWVVKPLYEKLKSATKEEDDVLFPPMHHEDLPRFPEPGGLPPPLEEPPQKRGEELPGNNVDLKNMSIYPSGVDLPWVNPGHSVSSYGPAVFGTAQSKTLPPNTLTPEEVKELRETLKNIRTSIDKMSGITMSS